MIIYIMYNSRSCVTGRALFQSLKALNLPNVTFRFCNANPPQRTPHAVIRWGNSIHDVANSVIELNSKEALQNTTDKAKMLRLLQDADGVRIPAVAFGPNLSTTAVGGLTDESGNMYIRNSSDHVRYGSDLRGTDKYALQPISKTNEYRVHIFNGQTIGIYEKIPHDRSVKIYKDANCDFRRIDMGTETNRTYLRGVRPMAKAAVEALGLLFGGVDVLRGPDGQFYITEVNSAPALNEPNVERWTEAFREYLTGNVLNTTAPEQTPETVQETVQPNPATVRREARVNLEGRIRTLVEQEGFSIRSLELV